MAMNRITSSFLNQQSVFLLNNNLSTLSNTQVKLSSGQNINKPSDDPVGLTRILDLANTLSTDARYARNIDDAISETSTADTALNNMVTLIQRAQELTTQAANFTNNQDGRTAIAQEIDQIINQLVQLGNTDIGGKYIFGGMKTDSPPFTRVGDDIIYSGTPASQNWQRNVEISRSIQLTVNINGDQLLGNAQVTTAGPPLPPVFSGTSQGLFKTLVELKQDLLNGSGEPNQLTEIRNRLDDLTNDMNNVLGKQAIIGAVGNRLTLTQGRIEERKSILTQQYAGIQDINLAETIANLNYQQNVLQASLGVTAKIMQTSLLDFLR
jgi:flagellar hook-associated protein 3 FlgL